MKRPNPPYRAHSGPAEVKPTATTGPDPYNPRGADSESRHRATGHNERAPLKPLLSLTLALIFIGLILTASAVAQTVNLWLWGSTGA